jgi:hypothetical protein
MTAGAAAVNSNILDPNQAASIDLDHQRQKQQDIYMSMIQSIIEQ